MKLPRTFEWAVNDEQGQPLVHIRAVACDDYEYGLAAGFAGSFDYEGSYRNEPICGGGYIEWIDRR